MSKLITRSTITIKSQSFVNAEDYVQFLLDLFASENCGYEAAVEWRREAYQKGLIISRQHSLFDGGSKLIIDTEWKDLSSLKEYQETNEEALRKAKVALSKVDGFIEEFEEVDAFVSGAMDSIIFDKYKS